jgi:hypothetical protein
MVTLFLWPAWYVKRGTGLLLLWSIPPCYATFRVAALTQRVLDSGKRFCCLYTDLTNPTSNSIYQRIGYREICDVDDWIFE